MQAIRPPRDGFALIIVIVGVLILSGVTLTALRMGSDEASAARATRISASALYAADAGVRATQIAWPTSATSLNAGDSLADDSWTPIGNGSSYKRTIHRRDAGVGTRVYSLTVEGKTYGPLGGEATVQVWLTSVPARFMAGISSKTSVDIRGTGAYTDAFDSRLGAYGGTNIANQGDIQANGNVTLAGGTLVNGDVTVGGVVSVGGSDPYNTTGVVSGTTTTGAPIVSYPQESCPSGGFSPFTPPTNVTYNQSTGMMWAKSNITLTTGTYFFHELKLSNGAQLIVPAGDSVTVYISSNVNTTSGAGINNVSRRASDMGFVSCGSRTDSWTLTGGTDAYFTVYAPNNKITFVGNGDFHGAVVAGELLVTGGTPFHFDLALTSMAGRTSLVSRSWFQMLR